MSRFHAANLTAYVEQILVTRGVPQDGARTTADCLTAANLRGVDSHGVRLLTIYIRRLDLGVMNPRPHLRVEHEGPAFAAIDGDNGLGPVVGAFAMDKAIALARNSGVAAVTVRRSNHFGAAAWYGLRAVDAGLIGLATSNGTPALAPWGGRAPFFGANPLAVAVPAGREPPIVVDLATSASSRARIRQRAATGEPIPEGWAIDSAGRPTTDPAQAIAGALLPIGGPKGYGIALALEILAGTLAGAGSSYENHDLYGNLDEPQGIGHFFLALNPAAFLGHGSFRDRVDTLIQALHDAPPATGVDSVRVPGELSAARRQERLEYGIALPSAVVAELAALGEPHGIAFPSAIGESASQGGDSS